MAAGEIGKFVTNLIQFGLRNNPEISRGMFAVSSRCVAPVEQEIISPMLIIFNLSSPNVACFAESFSPLSLREIPVLAK